jgi:hypothetical protein
MMMGMVSVGWVAVLLLQAGDPTHVDPDRPVVPEGPVHRKASEPLTGPAPVAPRPAQEQQPPATTNEATDETTASPPTEVSGSVRVRSEMGKRFRLMEVTVAMDGAQVAQRRAPQGSELPREFTAFNGSLTPGQHAMSVTMVYQGRNAGLFNYMDDYTFRVQSAHAFETHSQGPATLEVVAKEKKGFGVPLEQKPMMEIRELAGASGTTVSVQAGDNPPAQ